MSSLERNKALVLEFIRLAADNSADAALKLLHPEATWWVAGDPARLRVAGRKNRSQIDRCAALRRRFPRECR